MKEFLEKFGLTEILSHLFPGFIALCAVLIWVTPSPVDLLGNDLGKNEFLLGVLGLVFAYAVGLMLSMWGLAGAQAAINIPVVPSATFGDRLRFSGLWIRWKYVAVAAGMPALPYAALLGLVEMRDLIEDVFGAASMPLLVDPTTQMTVFRGALCERIKAKVENMVMEPEVQRRRYMFAIGLAVAMMVLSASALARLVVALVARIPAVQLQYSAPWRTFVPPLLFILLAIFAAFSGWRIAGSRKWMAVLLWIVAALGVAAATGASGFRPLPLPWRPFLPGLALAALALLAAICVAVCFRLRAAIGVGNALLWLFGASIVCVAGSIFANLPLQWLGVAASWDARNPHRPWLLLGIVLVTYFVSLRLRKVATQCLAREVAHTLVIVRLFGHYF